MLKLARPLAVLAFAVAASPALAGEVGAQVPEASAVTLFALGVLGVLVGRQASKRSKDQDND
jgi:hypothetical protein